jgi:hypothetical protein
MENRRSQGSSSRSNTTETQITSGVVFSTDLCSKVILSTSNIESPPITAGTPL